jgi:tRNA (mo5U34)-methyltransferase
MSRSSTSGAVPLSFIAFALGVASGIVVVVASSVVASSPSTGQNLGHNEDEQGEELSRRPRQTATPQAANAPLKQGQLPKIEDPATIPLPRQGLMGSSDNSSDKDATTVIPSFTLASEHDNLYQERGPKPFQFNHEVVQVFDDMISRSVPLYREAMVTLLHWVAHYYQPSTRIYDLGCSTGTTLDFIARSFFQSKNERNHPGPGFRFVGVDNSVAMIEKARDKLSWANKESDQVDLIHEDLMQVPIDQASIVIMNYTLQFIPVHKRLTLLTTICEGLCDNGILFLSEKVRSSSTEFQETCTHIYEDFKYQRGYTQTEIARKKEALMNVLVPHTEEELMQMLEDAGFHHAQVVVKWNNFTTIVAIKKGPRRKESVASCDDRSIASHTKKATAASVASTKASTECPNFEHMEALFELNQPTYLNLIQAPTEEKKQQAIQELLKYRDVCFRKNLKRASKNIGGPAKFLRELPDVKTGFFIRDNSVFQIGKADDLKGENLKKMNDCLTMMRPWKKGPLNLFGTDIETEWRSDWKWKRLVEHIDSLDQHVVCDLGCANGYFMFRMLHDFDPALIVGIDPNHKAWLEFQCFQKFVQSDKLVLEVMDGDCMDKLVGMFDTVFCLGVLYHTTDPISMLRKIYTSMKAGGQLVVDCQGIPGDDPVALFPKTRYTNAKGFWFLPTITTLKNWLTRTNFGKIEVFYSELLSTEEQHANPDWANMTSLHEGLDPNDSTKTKEGYPAPHRFYLKCYRN